MREAALWAAAIFVFSIPYENGVSIPGVGSLARLVGIAAIGVTVMSLVDQGRLRLRAPSVFLVMAVAYFVWSVASYFWSIDPSRSFSRVASLAQLVAMVWMIHQVAASERHRSLLGQSFVLGAYAGIFVALAARIGSPDGSFRDVGGINPNWFAIGCALVIPVAWGLALRARNRLLFWVNALYPAFALLAVVLAASRGGLITALVALAVIPLTLTRLSWARRLLLVTVLALGGWGILAFAPQALLDLQVNIERLEGTAVELGEGTLTGRTRIWASGMDAFRESPIVGHGAGTFSRTVAESLGSARGAHNGFLSVMVSVGLVGLMLFIGLVAVVVAGAVLTPARRIELLILVASLLVGLTPANMEHTKTVWFILAFVAVTRPITIVPWARSAARPARPAPHDGGLPVTVDGR